MIYDLNFVLQLFIRINYLLLTSGMDRSGGFRGTVSPPITAQAISQPGEILESQARSQEKHWYPAYPQRLVFVWQPMGNLAGFCGIVTVGFEKLNCHDGCGLC
jgi:hypothetical protein